MELSTSLLDEDFDFLDAQVEQQGMAHRSAAVQKAVRSLRASGRGAAYEEAWSEWERDGDAVLWDAAVGDDPRR